MAESTDGKHSHLKVGYAGMICSSTLAIRVFDTRLEEIC